ncbi:glycosyltransferase 87 family protein [Streptomyces sp. NPDC047000]|uniref:glycosyltransferase 87 family protein n=1 Tax=Streptomyces sp. NPDC047000 TaxID=3155474 RepID=UPI00340B24D3
MLWILLHDDLPVFGGGHVAREVYGLYFRWYGVLTHGAFPAHDPLWQYPPGAGLVLLAPGLLPGLTYFQAFVVLALAADAAVTVALARTGSRPGRSRHGAVYWICCLPLLLHLPFTRYDVQVTAFAVLSLLVLARSPRASGVFAALGSLIKVWPVLVLLGLERGRTTRRAWTWAALTGTVSFAVLALSFSHPLSFVLQQGGRGVQIESFGGTVLSLARHAGWHGGVRYQFGAMEFTGRYVGAVAGVSLVLTGVAFGVLLLWRLRARRWTAATPYDAALTAVLLFTVTSRVISPQYMIWLLGLAAVCLTSRHTALRPVTALIAAATAVSTVIYPVLYRDVIVCDWTGSTLILLRNGLLGVAAVLSFTRLWRSTRPAPPLPRSVPGTRPPVPAVPAARSGPVA